MFNVEIADLELVTLFRRALFSEDQKELRAGNGGAFVCGSHLMMPNE